MKKLIVTALVALCMGTTFAQDGSKYAKKDVSWNKSCCQKENASAKAYNSCKSGSVWPEDMTFQKEAACKKACKPAKKKGC